MQKRATTSQSIFNQNRRRRKFDTKSVLIKVITSKILPNYGLLLTEGYQYTAGVRFNNPIGASAKQASIMSTKVQSSSNLPARLVLSLVHLLYSILQQLLLVCGWIRWKLSTYQRKIFSNERQNATPAGCRNSSTQLRCENDAIEYDVRGLDKIPSHLVVMLGPEEPEYKQLAKFIFWSMAAGVGHVSFYDHRGKKGSIVRNIVVLCCSLIASFPILHYHVSLCSIQVAYRNRTCDYFCNL